MTVRIVVDSTAGLSLSTAAEHHITVLPMHVMEEDGATTTAGLSVLELCAGYARQLERSGDDGVVALHLARELSSTAAHAATAAAVFEGAVRVIPTGTAGMAVGLAAVAAARRAAEGASVEECAALAQDVVASSSTWLYLHRLDHLRRSGRLSAGVSVMSSILATKPIVRLRGGELELAAKTRTQSKAFQRLAELVAPEACHRPVHVVVQVADSLADGHELVRVLSDVLPEGSDVMLSRLDRAVAVHTGPGALAVSALYEFPVPES